MNSVMERTAEQVFREVLCGHVVSVGASHSQLLPIDTPKRHFLHFGLAKKRDLSTTTAFAVCSYANNCSGAR